MKKEINKSIIILYILIILIIASNVFYYVKYINSEKWQCSLYQCTKVKTTEEWINENCVLDSLDNKKTLCNIIINNTKQLIPLEIINQDQLQQLLNQQCLKANCIQETKVRSVNYTIDMTSQK
jgi:hypothetical protein